MPVKYKPRPPTVAICPVCGKQAIGRKGITFCGNACKQRDKRRKRKAETTMTASMDTAIGTCRHCGHAMNLHREAGCLGDGWKVTPPKNTPACKCIVKARGVSPSGI